MQTAVQFGTTWFPDTKTIDTRISGHVTIQHVISWEDSLLRALSEVPDNGTFKILVDLFGFNALDLDAHKRFRSVIPVTLSQYGWKVGYVDLFAEASETIQYANIRGIHCFGAAHVHQDETKIGLYERSYSRSDEHYFTDPEEARTWLEQLNSSHK